MWAFPQAMGEAGTSGALIRVPGVPSGGNSTLVYFGCEDCAVEASRVVAADPDDPPPVGGQARRVPRRASRRS